MSLQVGQKLWLVPNQRYYGEAREVTVTKVGRKWATIGDREQRVNVETLAVDGGAYLSPAQCYMDREAYERKKALAACFDKLRQYLGYSPKPGVTLEDVREAARLLRIEEAA